MVNHVVGNEMIYSGTKQIKAPIPFIASLHKTGHVLIALQALCIR
jgi:hypothetical protein